MAKYQQYAEYKDSGVEWLGEIPRDWMATELKRNCKVTDGSHHSPAIEVEGLPFISVTDVGVNKINFIDSKKISDQSFERLVKEGCKPSVGDVLLTKDGTIGRACIVTEQMPDFVILSSLGLLTPSKKLINKYLYYYLISGINIDQMNSVIHGSALRRMTISKINDLVIAFPQTEEDQTQIANFLDHETAQIDTLIDKQQTLIQLLKEKRQAVISHAVTKGLNPNAPMKDSGVEWLGEVPEHWEVRKLKYVCDLITKKTEIHNQYVIALENIESWTGNFVSSDSNYSGQDVGFDTGDILFSKLRPYLAKVYLAQAEGVAFGDLLVYRPKKELLNKYGFYLMTNEGFINTVNSSTYGSKMPRASTEFISEMPVVIPLLQEQKQIVAYVDKILARFDSLVLKAETAIQLMQERRTALISAAVTGKIDVRGWRASE